MSVGADLAEVSFVLPVGIVVWTLSGRTGVRREISRALRDIGQWFAATGRWLIPKREDKHAQHVAAMEAEIFGESTVAYRDRVVAEVGASLETKPVADGYYGQLAAMLARQHHQAAAVGPIVHLVLDDGTVRDLRLPGNWTLEQVQEWRREFARAGKPMPLLDAHEYPV